MSITFWKVYVMCYNLLTSGRCAGGVGGGSESRPGGAQPRGQQGTLNGVWINTLPSLFLLLLFPFLWFLSDEPRIWGQVRNKGFSVHRPGCLSISALMTFLRNLTVFLVLVGLVSERVEIVVLVRRADGLEAVVAVFTGLLVRLVGLALVWAGTW